MQPGPTICRSVIYRSRTGDYDVPAVVNCTTATLSPKGVEAGHVPDLSSPEHVHLTVFTPGKPGLRRSAEDFEVLPEGGHEALSENVAGCYQEWNIPPASDYQNPEPGTWRWPHIAGGDDGETMGGEDQGRETAQSGLPADARLYTNDPVTLEALKFEAYRKIEDTEMAPVTGPFRVSTKEGAYELPEGWEGYIALDADGDPYPVEQSVADRTYVHVGSFKKA